MNVLILYPRLDISWKEKTAPKIRNEIPSNVRHIKLLWLDFVNKYKQKLQNEGNRVETKEIVLGGLTKEEVDHYSKDYDLVLVPHRQKKQFDCGSKAMYYMQMVFPWLFSIDKEGWCGGASTYPIEPKNFKDHPNYDFLLEYCNKGESKFKQKRKDNFIFPEEFILYTLQIPYDQTIKYHSDIEVIDAMSQTLTFGKENNIPVLVKTHPALKERFKKEFKIRMKKIGWGEWIEDVHILQCIQNCDAMVTVNSGTGMEAIIQKKPIFTFGKADYDSCAWKELNIETWKNKESKIYMYEDFIETYCRQMFNVNGEI